MSIMYLRNIKEWCALALCLSIPISTTLTSILVVCIIALFLLQAVLQTPSYQENVRALYALPVTKICLSFFIIFLAGMLYTTAPLSDSLQTVKKMSSLLMLPLFIELYASAKVRQQALMLFLWVMFCSAVLGILKLHLSWPILHQSRFVEAAFFKDHIFTNFMMGYAAFVLSHWSLHWTTSKKLFSWGIIVFFLYYIFFISNGRSGYVIGLSFMALFGWQQGRWKGFVVTSLCALLVLCFAYNFSDIFQKRVINVYHTLYHSSAHSSFAAINEHSAEAAVSQRIEFIQNCKQLIKDKFWIGWGTGSFKFQYAHYAAINKWQPIDNPHNEYIYILVQLGIIGLASFIAFLNRLWFFACKLPKFEQCLAQGMVVGLSIGCLANSWLSDFTSRYFFMCMLAICFATYNKNIENRYNV